jgi:hypothetical protein
LDRHHTESRRPLCGMKQVTGARGREADQGSAALQTQTAGDFPKNGGESLSQTSRTESRGQARSEDGLSISAGSRGGRPEPCGPRENGVCDGDTDRNPEDEAIGIESRIVRGRGNIDTGQLARRVRGVEQTKARIERRESIRGTQRDLDAESDLTRTVRAASSVGSV